MNSVDILVLGGLPVTVEYSIGRAEPDIGIMSSYVDEWSITHVNNRPCKKPPHWLYNRIDADKNGQTKIIDAINEAGE